MNSIVTAPHPEHSYGPAAHGGREKSGTHLQSSLYAAVGATRESARPARDCVSGSMDSVRAEHDEKRGRHRVGGE